MKIRAVVFDLGGVVFESPVAALRSLEQREGLEPGSIGAMLRRNAGGSAFAALERGEIDAAAFFADFDRELAVAGLATSGRAVLGAIESAMQVRPVMLEAVRLARNAGFRVAALTNNARTSTQTGARFDALHAEFDVFVESCRVGARKPEAAIYHALAEALALPFEAMVFLDDLGANLKTGRSLGMTTIKVGDPDAAVRQLQSVLAGA